MELYFHEVIFRAMIIAYITRLQPNDVVTRSLPHSTLAVHLYRNPPVSVLTLHRIHNLRPRCLPQSMAGLFLRG